MTCLATSTMVSGTLDASATPMKNKQNPFANGIGRVIKNASVAVAAWCPRKAGVPVVAKNTFSTHTWSGGERFDRDLSRVSSAQQGGVYSFLHF